MNIFKRYELLCNGLSNEPVAMQYRIHHMQRLTAFFHIPINVLVRNALCKPTVFVLIVHHITPRSLVAMSEEDTTKFNLTTDRAQSSYRISRVLQDTVAKYKIEAVVGVRDLKDRSLGQD